MLTDPRMSRVLCVFPLSMMPVWFKILDNIIREESDLPVNAG